MTKHSLYKLTVETTVHTPVEKVWEYWTEPHHISKWSDASDDWHAENAENVLRVGGSFLTRMEALDLILMEFMMK